MLKVHKISKETIKPSSPTPPRLSSIPLSALDHKAPHIFTHIVLFYSSSNPLPQLKTSLSKTLVHFFPLAGRITISDDRILHVACNDAGVEFTEAETQSDLNSFLREPIIDELPMLLSVKKDQFNYSDPLLATQVTQFACGGQALGFSISHILADGASMAAFLHVWADISQGLGVSSPPLFNSASAFPPLPGSARDSTSQAASPKSEAEVVIRRFVLDADAVERLRSSAYIPDQALRPTKVEAVSTIAWRCLARAKGMKAPGVLSFVVNFRKKKMSLPLSDATFGNLWVRAVVVGGNKEQEAIREAVRGVDESYVRTWIEKVDESSSWIFTSWCRMGFHSVDFGWGGPVWVGCGLRDMKDVCVLIDRRDEAGVEVWLWLDKKEMEVIERDSEFLSFVAS